jgi:hypothetical protein
MNMNMHMITPMIMHVVTPMNMEMREDHTAAAVPMAMCTAADGMTYTATRLSPMV